MIKMQLDLIIQLDDMSFDLNNTLLKVAECCIKVEGVQFPCIACAILTDSNGIRKINRERRNIDSETDVLSFPTIEYLTGTTASDVPGLLRREWDDIANACMLGDIVVSVPKAITQAQQYGHSIEREVSYLFAHGLFHLLGYDHQTRKGKVQMRKMEEKALDMTGLSRISDQEMLAAAQKALKNAYAPYSHFRVGASLLCNDGRIFTGCNIENASYGLTNCAERTALFKAVSEGATSFDTIVIMAEKTAPWPCGACRQVLNEFSPNLRVLVSWDGGHLEETYLKELLPHGFGPDSGMLNYLGKDHV